MSSVEPGCSIFSCWGSGFGPADFGSVVARCCKVLLSGIYFPPGAEEIRCAASENSLLQQNPQGSNAEARSKCRVRTARTTWSPITFLMQKFGTDLFDSPNRAALVELTFFADKGGRGTAEDPYVVIGWLLSNHWSNDPGETAEFNVENKIYGLVLD